MSGFFIRLNTFIPTNGQISKITVIFKNAEGMQQVEDIERIKQSY